MMVMVGLVLHWTWLVGCIILFQVLDGSLGWTMTSLGCCFLFTALCYVYLFLVSGFLPSISCCNRLVGLSGLCPSLRTICAWFVLVRKCVCWLANECNLLVVG